MRVPVWVTKGKKQLVKGLKGAVLSFCQECESIEVSTMKF